jgi:hypothetical protein
MEALKMKGFFRKQQAEQTQSLEALLENATDNSSLDTVISQAALQLRIGRVEEAKKLAEHVLAATSTSEKDRVIAHLLLSHADPKTSAFHLEKAWAIADEADDFNLLKAISNTADELNHPIAVLHGPKMNS